MKMLGRKEPTLVVLGIELLHSTPGIYFMQTKLYRPMSTLQRSRKHFVPTTPKCYVDVLNTKISLIRTTLPIKAELMPIFPTLLANGAEGMPNIEIVVDNENGTVLKSDKALRVSKIKVCEL